MTNVRIIGELVLTLMVVGSQSVQSDETATESLQASNKSQSIGCPDCCNCSNRTVFCLDGWNKITISNLTGRAKIIHVLLANGNVPTLTASLFQEMSFLKELTLLNSGIKEISPGAFDGLNRLNLLILSGNDIRTIQKGTFEPLQGLQKLLITNNNIAEIEDGAFAGLRNLTFLWLENNIRQIHPGAFDDLGNLTNLILENNCIEEIVPGTFKGLHKIEQIELGNNSISKIENGTFEGLHSLIVLSLKNNPIVKIDLGGFNGLTGLTKLDISFNKLTAIEPWFRDMDKLQILYATNTPFEVVQSNAFHGLGQLKIMELSRGSDTKGRQIEVKDGALDDLVMLQKLFVDERRICCMFVSAIPSFNYSNCIFKDWTLLLYHCGTLMWNNSMRACLWIIGVTSILGNVLVIVKRCWLGSVANESEVHTFMVLNLALSDLIMGIYMMIIAIADLTYGETYSNHAEEWRSGTVCSIAGVLSVLSSEASVFFITLIGVHCFLLIVFPYSRIKIGGKVSKVTVWVIWGVAGFLSVPFITARERGVTDLCITLPLVPIPSGNVSNNNAGYFDASPGTGVSRDEQKPRVYSIILFVVINMLCFIILICCYAAIFVSIKRSAKRVKATARRKRETLLAIKMMLVVVTDFACWMPVIIMGVLSQTGAAEIALDTFAWTVVLILPINSSLNPIIYTLYTKLMAKKWRCIG